MARDPAVSAGAIASSRGSTTIKPKVLREKVRGAATHEADRRSTMATSETLYLGLCCLKRPFDEQVGERVRLQSEAMKALLGA